MTRYPRFVADMLNTFFMYGPVGCDFYSLDKRESFSALHLRWNWMDVRNETVIMREVKPGRVPVTHFFKRNRLYV